MLDSPYGPGRHDEYVLQAPRTALLLTLAVLASHTVITVLNVLSRNPGPSRLTLLCLCLAAILALQFAHSTRHPRSWPFPVRMLTLSAQAVVTFLPLAWFGLLWGAMVGLLAGSALLSVSGPLRWGLYTVTMGAFAGYATLTAPEVALYDVGATMLASLIIYGISSLSGLVAELHTTRRLLAGMAVVQERLRVASDLHDLLGYSLSAITLKTEVAYRLLQTAPERARTEVTEVLGIARGALTDVGLLASGDRDMTLAAEAESALSILSAARITVEADLACGELPQELDTVLAIVLREAVTNMLRHSKAQHCAITAVRAAGTVSLRIRNDGVGQEDRDSVAEGGSGLGNLTLRMRRVGGELTSGQTDDDWFEVAATVPVVPGDHKDAEAEPEGRAQAAQRWAPRMARGMLLAVLAGYSVIVVINAQPYARSGAAMLGFLGCLAVVLVLQAFHSLRRPRTWPVRTRVLTLALQAAATYAPLLWLGRPWGSMTGFLAGSLLIVLPGRLGWALYTASVAATVPAAAAVAIPLWTKAYLTQSSLLAGLVVYGFTSLYLLVSELHEARGALAMLAVARERLIVERELHAALGSSLSAITMQCALIHRLVPQAPAVAADELSTVLAVSRQALADVRRVARGYRGQPGDQDRADREKPFPDSHLAATRGH